METRKPGRPRIPKVHMRTARLVVAFKEHEHARIRRLARHMGVPVATLVRELALDSLASREQTDERER